MKAVGDPMRRRGDGVTLDEKKMSGGHPFYEAKFNPWNGQRVEVHISPEGKVLQVEGKPPKT